MQKLRREEVNKKGETDEADSSSLKQGERRRGGPFAKFFYAFSDPSLIPVPSHSKRKKCTCSP